MKDQQYVAAVEAHLTDLPWSVRKNLVDDLRVHLGDLPESKNLVARLGDPATYAADLRSAAGLTRQRGPIAFVRARRPRNIAIAFVLLVLAAALAGAVAWGSSYQPVSTGSTWVNPIPSTQGAVGETVATFRNGKSFRYGLSIMNRGRFPIRILGIPLDPHFHSPFIVRPFVVPSETDMTLPPLPFRPFTLEPGHERLIVLRGTYTNCRDYSEGSGLTVEALPVRERFLLWNHTVWITLPRPVVIRFPKHPCLSR
jgi:hypothetical protein